jgi:hypothetical protein
MSALAREKNVFTWTAHPAAERPGMALVACAVIALLAAAAWWSFGWMWAVVSALVLVLSLNRFFFASRFVVDDDSITARYLFRSQRLLWKEVRRFVSDARGGYLSTRAVASRLDAYRGLHVIFGADRATVVELIKNRIRARDERAGESHALATAQGVA